MKRFNGWMKDKHTRFIKGINRYFEAILVEIRGGLIKSPLHILKTVVIFFIPFLYAFTYLWAFYDPISKTDDLNLTIVTSKDDALGEFVKTKAVNKGIQVHNGPNVEMTASFKHIYEDPSNPITSESDVVKNSLMTIHVPDMDHRMVSTIRRAVTEYTAAAASGSTTNQLEALAKSLAYFITSNTYDGKSATNYNYKSNFLIGFATDISSAQSGGINEVMNMLIQALTIGGSENLLAKMVVGDVDRDGKVHGTWLGSDGNPDPAYSIAHHQWVNPSTPDPFFPQPSNVREFQTFMTAMQSHIAEVAKLVSHEGGYIRNANAPNEFKNAVEVITMHSQLGTHGKQNFGIGLSPFFISIGMWFGAVAMTVLIHRKIYDRKTLVKWRYMAKGTLINAGVIIQASVLLIALKFIGLNILGPQQWAIMYGSAIFAGIIFATFIMAIRLSIPSRALSIYIIVIFMVLNIVCSGGLFPIQTQNVFVRSMNTWLPMHFSVEMLRQGLADTNWAVWGENFGYLSIYLLFVPIGVGLNFMYTHRWYIRHDFVMPSHMQRYHDKWLERSPRKNKAIVRRLRKSGRNLKKRGDL